MVACVAVAVVASVVIGAGVVGGCADPCTFLGGGCNVDGDCPSGEVCHIPRAFEANACSVVRGRCVGRQSIGGGAVAPKNAKLCGSVDDCAANECCDPTTNACVVDADYAATNGCDARTCRDCAQTEIGPRCTLTKRTCADGEVCAESATSEAGNGEGACRPGCSVDGDCGAFARCFDQGNGFFCSPPAGTPCDRVADDTGANDRVCLGLTCIDLDAGGQTVAPYCATSCDAGNGCPLGFKCDASKDLCRRS